MIKKEWVLDIQDTDIPIESIRDELYDNISNGCYTEFYPLEETYEDMSNIERDIMAELLKCPEFEAEFLAKTKDLKVNIKIWW